MLLLDADIRKFQELYKARFGMDISKEEALAKGTQLLRLMELVYKPMTKEESEVIQKRRIETLPLLAHKLQNNESESRVTYDQRGARQN
jgi:aldehyde:ferredoxin oxidoreductase